MVPSKSNKLKNLEKNIFVGILKVTDEKSRIRIGKFKVRIRGSGSVPKCHGSGTLNRYHGCYVKERRTYPQKLITLFKLIFSFVIAVHYFQLIKFKLFANLPTDFRARKSVLCVEFPSPGELFFVLLG
jgi:hypothetical protein